MRRFSGSRCHYKKYFFLDRSVLARTILNESTEYLLDFLGPRDSRSISSVVQFNPELKYKCQNSILTDFLRVIFVGP